MGTTTDEAKLKSQFQASEELRTEFANDFESFVVFSKANLAGRVRLCMGKCSMMSLEEFRCSEELERLGREIEKKTAEIKRAKELQMKSAEDESGQYENAEPCEV